MHLTGHLLTTDIADPGRLRRAARICERFGERIQESVYWLTLDSPQLRQLQSELAKIVDPQHDSLRYYPVCARDFLRSTGEGRCHGLTRSPDYWIL